MARIANTERKIRLNLDLPERVRARLERVREMSEADSFTEVIRRALSLYDTLLTVTHEGKGRIILRVDGEEDRELTLLK